MREAQLILTASPCDANLYQEGLETLEQASMTGRSFCPHFETCNRPSFLEPQRGHQCVMLLGLQAAQASLRQEISVAAVMETCGDDIPRPVNGFIYSADRKNFTIITRPEALIKIVEFARVVIGGSDGQQDNPCVAEPASAPKSITYLRAIPAARRDPVEDFLTNL